VRFEPGGIEAEAPHGRVLMAVARQAGVHVEAPCGGQGWCGRCRVRVEGELSEHSPDELRLLRPDELRDGVRLACRARVEGDVVVHLAEERGDMRVVEAAEQPTLEVEPPESRGIACGERCLGAAIDVGTTSLALALVDLRSGRRVAIGSALNPQVAFGADVLTRVGRAIEGEAAALRSAVVTETERLLLGMLAEAGAGPGELVEAIVAGNTAMTRLFFGADVAPIAAAPYEGEFAVPLVATGEDLGMSRLPGLRFESLPSISAFVGGDIVGGLLATALSERDAPTLLLDLGTNGEIALRTSEGLFASSTAAGPAFEGAGISNGMRAEPGAIERAELRDGDLVVETVGDKPAVGVCGSGLVDVTAALLAAGALDASGRLLPEGALASRIADTDGARQVALADGVTLTQNDIRQLQLAKGAVGAGIGLLLEEAGLVPDDVDEIVLAGGFGLHVRPAALVAIGLLPKWWGERVSFAGNSSLAGAELALASSGARAAARRLAQEVRTLDLAAHPAFEQRFLGELAFPTG